MNVELVPLDRVRPYEGNPRVNDHAVESVAASIREFGFRQPIVVDASGVIIVGHTRWKAAKQLGLELVPVTVADNLTAEQARAYRLADNRLAEIAEWDKKLLAIELSDLRAADVDLGLLGFDAAELEGLLGAGINGNPGRTDPDSIPAPPAEATTKPGDLWLLGDHRLLCGDSSSGEDLDRLLGGLRAQLVHTDPPYNVNVAPRSAAAIAAGLSTFGGGSSDGAAVVELRAKDRPIENDCVSTAEYARLLAGWFGNASRALEPGRALYAWGGYANLTNYPPAFAAAGLHFSQTVVWVKEHPVLNRKDFLGNHELCFYGWREGAAHYFNPSVKPQDVWRLSRALEGTVGVGRGVNLVASDGSRIAVSPPSEKFRDVAIGDGVECYGDTPATDVWSVRKVSPTNMVHLTQKPVELAERAMAYSSRPGENVLDLFGGSGSTLIAAERVGRRAFLLELDPLYCDVIVKRFEEYSGKKATRAG